MKKYICVLFVQVALLQTQAQPQPNQVPVIHWREEFNNFRSGRVNVAATEMTVTRLSFLASRWLPKMCPTWTELYIVTDRTPSDVFGTAALDFSPRYNVWAKNVKTLSQRAGETARLLCLSRSAILDLRTASGKTIRTILWGNDFTSFTVCNEKCKIVHVSTIKYGPQAALRTLDVFIQTQIDLSKPYRQLARRTICHLLNTRNIYAFFRTDPYFINQGFPWFYPFWPPDGPPSEKDYQDVKTLLCLTDDGSDPHCQ